MSRKKEIKVAVIDMNNGTPNQGMRGIKEVLHQYKIQTGAPLSFDVFDLRQKEEIPGLDYDIYISSGGPGSPYEGEGLAWETNFFHLLDQVEEFNKENEQKKSFFFICHSFQLACRKYGLGKVTRRKSNAFGIFPISLTSEGEKDLIYQGLPNPFYSVDSRDWQVISPDEDKFSNTGAEILAIEKERPHVNLERCIMSIRFSREFAGTQFHPEADPIGMKMYLLQDEKKAAIIENHGEEKYLDMLNSLDDPERISLTQRIILPNFLNEAIQLLQQTEHDQQV
ncbi:GMP synthase [Pedobacter sp. HMWF019]|uniref:type 1 glutamine amidotransferase n=1 Tax=Pedobacter sp. HMWF019 TaxID=2056856 RepID=UPI000D331A1D|nr:GMP synthase [Pedobacter sp. HMWF019]PTT00837.1 GMP synthase [Pedobacter sp. HMWF019]